MNNYNAIALKYIDLRSSVLLQFQKSRQFPEDGKVRQKHVALDCDFNIILTERENVNIFIVALKMEDE
jgi:hypothetical protein